MANKTNRLFEVANGVASETEEGGICTLEVQARADGSFRLRMQRNLPDGREYYQFMFIDETFLDILAEKIAKAKR